MCRGKVREGTMLLEPCQGSGALPGICPLSSHFTHFPFVTRTLLSAALVMIPRVSGFVWVLGPCSHFKWTLLRNCKFLPYPNHHWFLQPEVVRLYLPGPGTLGCTVWSGAGIAGSPGIPPNSYQTHKIFINFMNVGVPVLPLLSLHAASHPLCTGTLSLPLLPIWMNVASLKPWLSGVFVLRLAVILLAVVRGGEACLPMPPFWPEVPFAFPSPLIFTDSATTWLLTGWIIQTLMLMH